MTAIPRGRTPHRGVRRGPLSGNVTVGIGVVSYAGQLNISVIADRDNCPDLPVFISGLDRSLSGLNGAAMTTTPPAGGSPAA